jgi:hypothetical protein
VIRQRKEVKTLLFYLDRESLTPPLDLLSYIGRKDTKVS